MPTYAYECRDGERTFTVRLSIKDHDSEPVCCPNCNSMKVEQVVAPFVAATSKKG